MTARTLDCQKCDGEMKPGFFVDHTHYGIPTVQTWIAGEMKKGWLGGAKLPMGKTMTVTTWRCSACGYLESYAKPKPAS